MHATQHAKEQKAIEPKAHTSGHQYVAGDNPTQVLDWAMEAIANAGTLSIIDVYPPTGRLTGEFVMRPIIFAFSAVLIGSLVPPTASA